MDAVRNDRVDAGGADRAAWLEALNSLVQMGLAKVERIDGREPVYVLDPSIQVAPAKV